MNNKIQIKNLYKIFGDKADQALKLVQGGLSKTELLEKHGHVLGLQNISLNIPEKQLHVVMGLSGSGKSTLIRHINRLIEPTAGEVLIDGEDVLSMSTQDLLNLRRQKTSMVFQRFGLLPHKRIIENVAFGLEVQHIDKDTALAKAQHWIERVGLLGYEQHFPAQLSGGMQQRVGLARALATDADILLMDEAFSALDPLIRFDMQSILLELQQELHKTIVFITHDLDEALRLGDRIAILRDGAVIQEGTAQDIVLRPADDYIADFTKDVNRAKVIRLGSIAQTSELVPGAPNLNEKMILQDALLEMANSPDQIINVLDDNKKPLGTIRLSDAISRLHG
ncbi:MAG TPA: glycine/betaine ABC transporter [Rhodobacter sp.]|jgi:glycine betaine/proline transport system ATP-binding protein|nr:glycine betaine/L-proline ABC transporter ATP-binding protein [Paracoccaceae bacterium]MDO7633091.1 glycine betaine/L-proline ABC transporter ATP-binding protein [Paracoccaceae bacterium]MDO7654472.1 glycine betaine/L-proline ABC transporter ATP-binding protein [Paracoccaceae bacterium]MDO7660124.1 glycine betaine/L-proline ABC transporter ATP-binding protein [Paracoccaceae bacterium]HCM98095.1 glycine/betaine ABC transporter [Rhodobacter sp.]|tara:strand:- start:334 stop:1347 length:1014 start_codon:yes stop_codon:yes gene_type:complete